MSESKKCKSSVWYSVAVYSLPTIGVLGYFVLLAQMCTPPTEQELQVREAKIEDDRRKYRKECFEHLTALLDVKYLEVTRHDTSYRGNHSIYFKHGGRVLLCEAGFHFHYPRVTTVVGGTP